MPRDTPSQQIAEISEALEVLRIQSLNHPDKAAKILSNAIGLHHVSSEGLTALAWRGATTEAEQDALAEDRRQILLKEQSTPQAKFCNDLQVSL